MKAKDERERISGLLEALNSQALHRLPDKGPPNDVPDDQGVYVIRSPEQEVLHVGRTTRGTRGLRQRLRDHLYAQSSFVNIFLKGDKSVLRRPGHAFQYLVVPCDRERALLEHLATAWHCPKHLGLGAEANSRLARTDRAATGL